MGVAIRSPPPKGEDAAHPAADGTHDNCLHPLCQELAMIQVKGNNFMIDSDEIKC